MKKIIWLILSVFLVSVCIAETKTFNFESAEIGCFSETNFIPENDYIKVISASAGITPEYHSFLEIDVASILLDLGSANIKSVNLQITPYFSYDTGGYAGSFNFVKNPDNSSLTGNVESDAAKLALGSKILSVGKFTQDTPFNIDISAYFKAQLASEYIAVGFTCDNNTASNIDCFYGYDLENVNFMPKLVVEYENVSVPEPASMALIFSLLGILIVLRRNLNL